MAKLSARGRTCKVEAVKEYSAEALKAHNPATELVWARKSHRLMSDGTILQKFDTMRLPSYAWQTGNQRDSTGWKVRGKLKAGLTAEDFARIYSAPRKDGSASRWVVTSHGLAGLKTPVISQARIMRAIESGESIGFCLACGAERDGCEPDARAYPCEDCGKNEVYGAEECLISAV